MLDLVQGVFGRGLILGAGPGPADVPSTDLQWHSGGPGPGGKMKPRPNIKGTTTNNVVDQVQRSVHDGPGPTASTGEHKNMAIIEVQTCSSTGEREY